MQVLTVVGVAEHYQDNIIYRDNNLLNIIELYLDITFSIIAQPYQLCMQFLFFAGQQELPANANLDTRTYYTSMYVVEWKPSDFIHLVNKMYCISRIIGEHYAGRFAQKKLLAGF